MANPTLRRILRFRWIIYLVLALVFGFQAYQARCVPHEPPAADEFDGLKPTRYIEGPDGQKVPIFELTPEQAEKHFGAKPAKANDNPPATTDAAVDTAEQLTNSALEAATDGVANESTVGQP